MKVSEAQLDLMAIEALDFFSSLSNREVEDLAQAASIGDIDKIPPVSFETLRELSRTIVEAV